MGRLDEQPRSQVGEAEAKAYMNSAVAAVVSQFSTIPTPPQKACSSPSSALSSGDVTGSASITFRALRYKLKKLGID